MATIELTIDLGDNKTTRMRFPPETMVPEVMGNIQEKLNKKETDMGLYRPENVESGRPAMWLPYGKPIREFQIKSNEVIFYKKRTRPLRYQLIDGTAKVVMIDDSATVEQISQKIGDHIGLKNYDEFGLRFVEDKTSWLDPVQTFQQLRIPLDKVLLYARRFFGETLDLADPFQLQLFFIEANKAILEDDLPCTREEAIHFAALQLQITFGNFDPAKHKEGWLKKADFLPLHWQKDKKIEIAIYKEYKKLAGMTGQQAKYRYYNDMRQMKSFGTTFFTCVMYYDDKKKKGGKKKQRLIKLGISREQFVVLDLTTREPLHEWLFIWHRNFRLKDLPNGESMVLIDFGDHLPSQLLIKSIHANQIGKMISGYIDLLLKAPQEAAQTALPEEFFQADEELMENAFSFPASGSSNVTVATGYFRGPNNTVFHPPSQRINIVNVTSAQRACSFLSDELGSAKGFVWVNPSELTLENAKIQYNSDKRAFASAVDDLLGTAKYNPSGLRRRDVDLKAQQLTAHVKAIAARARSIASFEDSPCLLGAKAVAESIANLFVYLDSATARPEGFPTMAEFLFNLEHAEKAIHRAQLLLEDSNKIFITDEGSCLMMLDFVKEIDMSFQHMMSSAEAASEGLPQSTKSELELALKQTKTAKDWLLSSMNELIPVIRDPKIMTAAHEVQSDILALAGFLIEACKKAGIDPYQLQASCNTIEDFCNEIFNAVNYSEKKGLQGNVDFATPATLLTCALSDLRTALHEPETLVDLSQPEIVPGPNVVEADKLNQFINEELAKLKTRPSDPSEFENNMQSLRESVAKQSVSPTALRSDPLSLLITSCSSSLVSLCMAVDVVTDAVDDKSQQRMKKAKVNLKDEFVLLEQYTEQLRDNPNSALYLAKVANTVGRLEGLTQQLVTDAGEMSAQNDLRFNTKVALGKAKALMVQASRCDPFVPDGHAKSELQNAIKVANMAIPGLSQVLQIAATHEQMKSQIELLTQAQWITQQFAAIVEIATTYSNQIQNEPLKEQFLGTLDEMYNTNIALWKSCNAVASITGEAQIETALEDLEAVKVDLDTASFAASQGLLKPVPGQTREEAIDILQASTSALTNHLNSLIETSKKGQPVATYHTLVTSCAKELAAVAQGTRMLATTIVDRELQQKIIGAGKEVHDKAVNVISIARVIASNYDYQSDPSKLDNLDTSNNAFQEAVKMLLLSSEGLQIGNVDDAIATIDASLSGMLSAAEGGKSVKLEEVTAALVSDAKALSAAVAQFTSVTLKNPYAFGQAAKVTGLTTSQLVVGCGDVASGLTDSGKKQEILKGAETLAENTKTLLVDAKKVLLEKSKPNLDEMKSAEKQVKESISSLLSTLGVPSSQTCDESISTIEALIGLLHEEEGEEVLAQAPKELYNSFFKSFQEVASVSGELSKASKSNNKDASFPIAILSKDAVGAVEGVVEATRVVDKMAHKWTPLEAKLLKDARMIQEDPLNVKEVINLTKVIAANSELLKGESEKFIASQKDPRVTELVKQAQRQLLNAVQNLQGVTKTQVGDRNVALIMEAAKVVGTRVKVLALLTKEKPALNDVLTIQFAEHLKEATRVTAIAMNGQLRAASAVVTYEDTEETTKELVRATATMSTALNDMIQLTSILNPGAQACDGATKAATKVTGLLEVAIIGLNFDGKFDPGAPVNRPLAHYQKECVTTLKTLNANVQKMAQHAKEADFEGLAQEARSIEQVIITFGDLARLTAAKIPEKEDQINMLETSKNLVDVISKVLGATKTLNLFDQKTIVKLDKQVAIASDVTGELLNELQSGAQVVTECETAIDHIKAHASKLADNVPPTNKGYTQSRSDLNEATKSLLTEGKRLLITDKTKGGEVGIILLSTVKAVEKLVVATNEIVSITADSEARKTIKDSTNNSIKETINMISLTAQTLQGQDKNDQISTSFKTLNANITEIYAAAQRGDIAERSLEKATKIINETIQQLNASSIFIQTGNLEIKDPEFNTLSREQIQAKLKVTMEQLEVEALAIMESGTGTDEQYGKGVVSVANQTSKMGAQAIWKAAKLEDQMSALELLNTAKGLSSKLNQLISSIKDARDKPDDATKQKIMISDEGSFKNIIADFKQATSTTEGSGMMKVEKELEQCKQSILSLLVDVPLYENVLAEDLVKAAKEVMTATAQLRFSATQDDVVDAGQKLSLETEKLIKVSNGVAQKLATDAKVAQKIQDNYKQSATAIVDLLESSKGSRQNPATNTKIEESSQTVTISITELLATLKLLPNTAGLQIEGEDFELKAEEELKKCSQIVESAKQNLEASKTKIQMDPTVEKLSTEINTALLTATMAITDATHKLVTTAETAQTERCGASATNKRQMKYNSDPTWANGLINATAQVTAAIQQLVRAANDAVENKGQEALVTATRNVAQATTNLVQASKAKSNPTVAGKLTTAAKLVANATSKLVEASNRANEMKNMTSEEDLSSLAITDESRIQELEQQMKILKLENELEKTKRQLARIKKRNN